TARRALAALVEIGGPGHRVRVLGTLGLALAHDGRLAEASAVFAELPGSRPAAGTRALLAGYLALARSDRAGAAARFAAAASEGRHDARDVVEALVGLACAVRDPAERASVLARLADARRRGAITLLPRERAMFATAGVPPPD